MDSDSSSKFSMKRPGSGTSGTGHGLKSTTSVGDTHGLKDLTGLGGSRDDQLKRVFEEREKAGSYSQHLEKIRSRTRSAHDSRPEDDIREMIRAKMRSEGEEVAEDRVSSMYDESSSDIQRMIRARRRAEAASRMEEESGETDGSQEQSDK